MNQHLILGAAILAAATSGVAQTAAPVDQGARLAQAQGAVASDFGEGEVRKVDKAAGKITLRHGEIKSLDMPAMTMVFVASKPEMLDQVKAGDKVRFRATNEGGAYMVTEIQAAK
jgi:Cu(I)/Ag(I) efflux system protein CusF